MKAIKTVGIIGLGALGTLYAHLFTQRLGRENVLVLADSARIRRYRSEGIYFNGMLCDFNYTCIEEAVAPLDLLLFTVKFGGLADSIEACRHLVGPDTIVISALNGISSEAMLSKAYGEEKIVWCVAQKMTAIKQGNRINVAPVGELALGVPAGMDNSRLLRLTDFFSSISFPFSLPEDIRRHMWSKLLCNTAYNQAAMVFESSYDGLREGRPLQIILDTMREVIQIANAEDIPLSDEDMTYWQNVIAGFPDDGEPSMRQDAKAHRKSEVELFSGTIRALGQKHGIPTPVNDWLYEKIKEMESAY